MRLVPAFSGLQVTLGSSHWPSAGASCHARNATCHTPCLLRHALTLRSPPAGFQPPCVPTLDEGLTPHARFAMPTIRPSSLLPTRAGLQPALRAPSRQTGRLPALIPLPQPSLAYLWDPIPHPHPQPPHLRSQHIQVFNPPYVPTPDEEVTHGGIAAAWAGGARGRRVTDRLLPLLPRLLSPRGEAFLVAVHENDPPGACGCVPLLGLCTAVAEQA